MRLCRKPEYITFAYTAGLLSMFGREDPNWMGTPPYHLPDNVAEERAKKYGYDKAEANKLVPNIDERTANEYLGFPAKVAPNASAEIKQKSALGKQSRKKYSGPQQVAIRRKRALRSQSLGLRDNLYSGRDDSPKKNSILRGFIDENQNPDSRSVVNHVNTIDRYERAVRGQLLPQEIADINAGKITLPTKRERDVAKKALIQNGLSMPSLTAEGIKQPLNLQSKLQNLESMQQIVKDAKPAKDVLSGLQRANIAEGKGKLRQDGSLKPIVIDNVTKRNALEAIRRADPTTSITDIANQRAIDPLYVPQSERKGAGGTPNTTLPSPQVELKVNKTIPNAPAYVAPSARDNNEPTGIKKKVPLDLEYKPTTKATGIQKRIDKFKRVSSYLDNDSSAYPRLDIRKKFEQDRQLASSQLPALLDKAKRAGKGIGNKVTEVANNTATNIGQTLNTVGQNTEQFINNVANAPDVQIPQKGTSTVTPPSPSPTPPQMAVEPEALNISSGPVNIDVGSGKRNTPLPPEAIPEGFMQPPVAPAPASAQTPTETKTGSGKKGKKKKQVVINPQEGQIPAETISSEGTPLLDKLREQRKRRLAGPEPVVPTSKTNIINQIRNAGKTIGKSRGLKAGAALAGAGGILLGGNLLANSLRKNAPVNAPSGTYESSYNPYPNPYSPNYPPQY